jgi:hypothetical protein
VNSVTVTPEDIRYIGDRLLELCFDVEERAKAAKQIEWLNDTLDQLGMPDRIFPMASRQP